MLIYVNWYLGRLILVKSTLEVILVNWHTLAYIPKAFWRKFGEQAIDFCGPG